MNWEAIGASGEIIGALAVFGTLLYLAKQIKQVKSELHLSSLRDTNQMGNQILTSLSESPDLAKVVSKANEDAGTLETWELIMLDSFFMRSLNSLELTLEQVESGALNAPKDAIVEVLRNSLNQPWALEAWERTRGGYPKRFQYLIDKQFDGIHEAGT
jgi:hypothetical protein